MLAFPKQESIPGIGDDDDDNNDDADDVTVKEEAQTYGRENVGNVPSPYRRRFLDTEYGIRKNGDIRIKGTVFRGKELLWELLTRKNVNTELINKDDLKTCKKILITTNAHFNRYQPGDYINIMRGKKFRDAIAPLFAKPKGRVSNPR